MTGLESGRITDSHTFIASGLERNLLLPIEERARPQSLVVLPGAARLFGNIFSSMPILVISAAADDAAPWLLAATATVSLN